MIGLTLALFGWKGFAALTCPIPIYCKAPNTQVFVDNQLANFGTDGVAQIYPWKDTYEVEIRTPRGTEKVRIYPFEEGSDSGCISIKRDRIDYYLAITPLSKLLPQAKPPQHYEEPE